MFSYCVLSYHRASFISKESEQEEDDGGLEDADDHAFDDVLAFEVADFVGEDADEAFCGVVFYEGVK